MTEETTEPSETAWTDEQEAALLKAIIQFKPVGMHKHFRMIAIRNFMIAQGVIHPDDEHTKATGIWKKLESLYDLPGLDEREDSVVNDGSDDQGEPLQVSYWRDFELPRDDYEALMWDRRLAPEHESSPDWSRRDSTVADTDEPRSSPVSVRGGATRGGRSTTRRGGRLSRLQVEIETERSSRRTSKAGSTADEDQVMEDVADEEDGTSSDDEEAEESEEPEDEEKKGPSRRGMRGAKRGRGRRGRRRG